jgi:glutamate-1-semialdehyde 2,1-aminomutase
MSTRDAAVDPAADTGTDAGLTNAGLFARALERIPGGVSSPVRAFGSVGGTPYFVARASGAVVTDVEGRDYLDYVQSYGAVILGHAHPAVTEAVQRAAAAGTSYGAPTPGEVRLAELVCDRVPSVERVRFVSSGTEATMSAIRVARGVTGKTKVVKFAGNYHGHSDGLLVSGGTAMASLGLPGSAGVTPSQVADTVVAPYNQVPELDGSVAAVIVEPVAANMGLVPPADGFLEGLRSACDDAGALLIFDEVITGFRVGPAGVQSWGGPVPDLTCFGKVIGHGLPIAAFGGRAELMDVLAPLGPVYQAGTLSGNPLATAAGAAALEALDATAYVTLEARAARLADGLQQVLDEAGIAAVVPRWRTLVGLFLGERAPTDYDGARTTDERTYAALFHALLDRGVAIAPGAYEVLFCGLAHTDGIIDRTLELAADAAAEVVRAR